MKERKSIKEFMHDVTDSDLRSIPPDFTGKIEIHGNVTLKEVFVIPSSILIHGSLLSEIDLSIDGNLYVEEGIDSACLSVVGKLTCNGNIDSCDIEVSSNLNCKGSICTNVYSIQVVGNLNCRGSIECSEITVDGNLHCEDTVHCKTISVKGNLVSKKGISRND